MFNLISKDSTEYLTLVARLNSVEVRLRKLECDHDIGNVEFGVNQSIGGYAKWCRSCGKILQLYSQCGERDYKKFLCDKYAHQALTAKRVLEESEKFVKKHCKEGKATC